MDFKIDRNKLQQRAQEVQKQKVQKAETGLSMQTILNNALMAQTPRPGGQMSMPAGSNNWGRIS